MEAVALHEIKGQMRAGDGGRPGGGAGQDASKCEISGLQIRWASNQEMKYGRCWANDRHQRGMNSSLMAFNSLGELEAITLGECVLAKLAHSATLRVYC